MFNLESFKEGQNALDRNGKEWRYVGQIMHSQYGYSFVAECKDGALVVVNDNGCNLDFNYKLVAMVSRHAELKKTYVNGDIWQFKYTGYSEWESCAIVPRWDEKSEYRLHPLNTFIKAYKSGENVTHIHLQVDDHFNWDDPNLTAEQFAIKPKTKTIYEWMWKNQQVDWVISSCLMTEEEASEHYTEEIYKKTGRSWDVAV